MQDKVDKKNFHFLLENRVQRNSYISALDGRSRPISQKIGTPMAMPLCDNYYRLKQSHLARL